MRQTHGPASVMLKAAMYLAYAGELREQIDASVETDNFATALGSAIDTFDVRAIAVASKFGVTKATISRWKNGEAVPGPYMRKEILSWLATTIESSAPIGDVEKEVRAKELMMQAQNG